MSKPIISKFDSKSYRSFRPLYPPELYRSFVSVLAGFSEPVTILDLACGTGQSLESLLRAAPKSRFRILALDHDAKMLEEGQKHFKTHYPETPVDWRVASAEQTGLADASVDAILIGSAVHWMDPEKTVRETRRILKPGGVLFIFEYQFPRSLKNQELNQWVKIQFNTLWKAPRQTPRGSLKELVQPFLKHFEQKEILSPPMHLELSIDDFFGDLVSQSRYLHYESTIDDIPSYRSDVHRKISESFGLKTDHFDFQLKGYLLRKNKE